MKQVVVFVLLLICTVRCESKTIFDSLRTEIIAERNESRKVEMMYRLASAYFKQDIDSGFYYAATAYALATTIHDEQGILMGLGTYARALIHLGKIEEAIKFSKKCLAYVDFHLRKAKSNEEKIKLTGCKAGVLKNLGIAFDYLANYPEALKYYTASLQLEESLHETKNSAGNYHNIGGVYLDLMQYDKALIYFQKAYVINRQFENKDWLTNNIINIAIVYSYKHAYDLALAKYREALILYEESNNEIGKLYALGNMGTMFSDMGKYDSASLYIESTLKLNESIGDPRTNLTAYATLCKIYMQKGEYSKANNVLKKIGKLAPELGDYSRLEEYYLALFTLDSIKGNYTSAIRNMQLSHMYRDSIYNEDNVRKLTQTQMNFDFEKKESEAKAIQEKKDILTKKEMQRQKLIRNSFLAGFAIVFVFASVLFRQRNKINKEKKRSEQLLLNILPAEVAEELKSKGSAEAQLMDEVTVLFTDFKGFTQLSEKLSPKELVSEINECFSAFDHIMQKHGVEKIKTIGDAYMAAGGLPTANKTHASDVTKAALEIQQFMHEHKAKREAEGKLFFEIRIGVHTGPVVAGIVGVKKFAYDIWGDTVNTASRMESSGEVGKVNISGTTYELVKDQFHCEHRGKITAKGKGEIDMYFVSA